MIDKTILRILSLGLATTGLFVVLTKFNVPQLNASFFDANPFAIKRDVVENVMTWLFTSLSLLGLFIELLATICANSYPDRLYSARFYFYITGITAVAMWLIFLCLSGIGRCAARRKWEPKIIESQAGVYRNAEYIITHDWWQENQYKQREQIKNSENYKKINHDIVDHNLNQIEELLDIERNITDPQARIKRLERFFKDAHANA
jgi:hypothetical protein